MISYNQSAASRPAVKQPAIQSVSRAISILRCFTEKREIGLTELSKMVGLHKSTTAGIVNTLKQEAFLTQNLDTGKLSLGIDLFCLAINAKLGLGELSMPYLNTLLQETGETVNLAVRDGVDIVYVEKKESLHSMRICTNVGQRLPLYCTAIGKAILAFLDRDEQKAILDKLEFYRYTEKTVMDRNTLKNVLEAVRDEGIAYDFEELETGLICVATPIFNRQSQPIASVSVSGPSMRMDADARSRIARLLLRESKAISARLSMSPTS